MALKISFDRKEWNDVAAVIKSMSEQSCCLEVRDNRNIRERFEEGIFQMHVVVDNIDYWLDCEVINIEKNISASIVTANFSASINHQNL